MPTVVKAADPAKARKSGIVTARKPGKQHAFVPDLAEEEVQRRRDTADAMMQDFRRQSPRRSGHDAPWHVLPWSRR